MSRVNAPFRLAGAAGPIEVPEGEWYINTKARARRMMQNSLSSDARRVHSCLELATMGYSQELAVTMENGKKRPLLSADIARQTGLHRREVDRNLAELEAAGLAERRPGNSSLPLQKGNIEIYSWASPKEINKLDPDCPCAWDNPPEWMPATWTDPKSTIFRTLKRFRIKPSPDFRPTNGFVEAVETLAEEYREIEDCLVAQLRLLSDAQEELSCASAKVEAPSLLLERNGKENNNNREPEAPAEPEPSVVVVLEALREHGTTTPAAAEKLAAACRKAKPGCTDAEIVETIATVAAGFSRSTRNPVGVLLTQVPQAIASRKPRAAPPDLDDLRRQMRSDSSDRIAAAESILANPNATPDDCRDAQEVLTWIIRGAP